MGLVEAALQTPGASSATTLAFATDHLTVPGGMLGTASYMSPEQVRAKELDSRTDLFSLGVVLYQMATGKLPFQGESTGVIYSEILAKNPPRPSQLHSGVSAELENIIHRALEKDRELRYQHAADMRADLQRLKRDSDAHRLAPVGRGALTARKRLGLFAAAALLATIAVAGYFRSHREPKLTDKDTIVLADFDNKTGDPIFDDTLKQGSQYSSHSRHFSTWLLSRKSTRL